MKTIFGFILILFLIGCRSMPNTSVATVEVEPTAVSTPITSAESQPPLLNPTQTDTAVSPTPQPSPTPTPLFGRNELMGEDPPANFPLELPPTRNPTITPTPNPVLTPLENVTQRIVSMLNTHAYADYPVGSSFFSGVYGVQTWQTDNHTTFYPRQLLTRYAGDTYGIRPLTITAEINAPLPLAWETAVSLNTTDYEVDHIVYSSGWGVDQPAEALLYFTESAGKLLWIGAIFSFDGFATPSQFQVEKPSEEVQAILDSEVERTAVWETLMENVDSAHEAITVNPSNTVAIKTYYGLSFTQSQYDLIDLDTNQTTKIGSDYYLRAAQAVWVDERFVLIGFYDHQEDEGPNFGHLGLLDTQTQELTPIEQGFLLSAPPTVTSDGTFVYFGHQFKAFVWKNGAVQQLDLKSISDLSNRTPPYVSSVSLSSNQRYIIGATTIDEPEISRSKGIYVLYDLELNHTQIVAIADPPPMGGNIPPATWNNRGDWAFIEPWTQFAEQDGLTVIEAETGASIFLGLGTGNGRWVNDTQLLFDAIINNEKQTHLLDVSTQKRVRLVESFPSLEGLILSQPDLEPPYMLIQNNEARTLSTFEAGQLLGNRSGTQLAIHEDAVFTIRHSAIIKITPEGEERFESDRIFQTVFGIVGDWLLVSSFANQEDNCCQWLGALTAVSLDGTQTQIIHDEFLATFPIVAPDQSRILFVANDTAFSWDKNGAFEQLTLPPFRQGTFSEDGTHLALLSNSEIQLYHFETETLITTAVNAMMGFGGYVFPVWHPNNQQVAFDSYFSEKEDPEIPFAIQILGVDGSLQELPATSFPVFSPDGNWLAYYQLVNNRTSLVGLFNLHTGERYLTTFAGIPQRWVPKEEIVNNQ